MEMARHLRRPHRVTAGVERSKNTADFYESRGINVFPRQNTGNRTSLIDVRVPVTGVCVPTQAGRSDLRRGKSMGPLWRLKALCTTNASAVSAHLHRQRFVCSFWWGLCVGLGAFNLPVEPLAERSGPLSHR